MASSLHIFRAPATSQWTGNWQLWFLALIGWSINSTLTLGSISDSLNYLEAGLANLVSIVVVLAIVALWRQVQHRRTGSGSIWLVVCVGALVGFAKGLVNYLVFWTLTGFAFTTQDLLQALITPIVFGVVAIVSIGVIGSVWADYDHERNLLIAARVSTKLQDEISATTIPHVTDLIQTARKTVASAPRTAAELTDALTSFAQTKVRHSSHQLWEAESASIGRFNPANLLASTIRSHNFPIVFIAPILFVGLVGNQLSKLPPLTAIILSVMQIAVICIGLYLISLIPTLPFFGSVLLYFLGSAAAVILTLIPHYFVTGRAITDQDIRIVLASIMVTWLVSLATGIATLARRTHEQVRSELNQYFDVGIATSAGVIVMELQQRQLAEYLHGYVQNFLLLSALRISDKPNDIQTVISEIEQMWQELEAGKISSTPSFNSLSDLCRYFQELWTGVIEVTVNTETSVVIAPTDLAIVNIIVAELISNAHRHGNASQISLSFEVATKRITIIAMDNGSGTSAGKPGLGSALLDAYTSNSWSIANRADTIGTKVQIHIPISAG